MLISWRRTTLHTWMDLNDRYRAKITSQGFTPNHVSNIFWFSIIFNGCCSEQEERASYLLCAYANQRRQWFENALPSYESIKRFKMSAILDFLRISGYFPELGSYWWNHPSVILRSKEPQNFYFLIKYW